MPEEITTFNRHQWALKWSQFWILLIGIVLLVLDLIIVSMEIGHTVLDLYRSTAFVGFIFFLPLLSSSICIIVAAFKYNHEWLRLTTVLSIVSIVLCFIVIFYDIFVLIDPTRCFLLDCNKAKVPLNSTYSVSGWPIDKISWPSEFQSTINAKRICQSVQLIAAFLSIIFLIFFLVTYFIYRNLDIHHRNVYRPSSPKKPTSNELARSTMVSFNNGTNRRVLARVWPTKTEL